MDHYIPYINTKRARDRINSMKEYNNQSLLHARRRGMSGKVNLDLLSMTLNIKRK